MKNICVLGRFHNDALHFLKSQRNMKVHWSSQGLLQEESQKPYHGLLIRSKTKLDKNLIEQCSQLQVVITATSGFDHIDFKACKEAQISLMHTPESNAHSAAELSWALLLATQRKLISGHQQIKQGIWERQKLRGHELRGKSLGLIGFGRVGRHVARFAQAFDMNVSAFDPYLETHEFSSRKVHRLGLDELIRTVDIISLHLPLTPETQNMLHRTYLENLQDMTTLINTSRGQIIREEEILYALTRGWLGAVGLDVFDKEPPRKSALLNHPAVTMTPHLGANTEEALYSSSMEAAQKLISFFDGGLISDELPPKTKWYRHPFGKSS